MIDPQSFGLSLPLANRDAWESLGSRFSGKQAQFHWGDLWALIGVVVAGVLLVALLRWLYRLQQARAGSCEPRHLFADLCRAHRFNRKQRRLLQELAEAANLMHPGVLFVRPELFEPAELQAMYLEHAEEYEKLAGKLFAGIEALEVAPASKAPTPTALEGTTASTPAPIELPLSPIDAVPTPRA